MPRTGVLRDTAVPAAFDALEDQPCDVVVLAPWGTPAREALMDLPEVLEAEHSVDASLSLGESLAATPALAWARPRWPAALSVLLPLAAPLPATAGGTTLAARIPARPSLRELLAALGHALTETSANPSGEPAFTGPGALRDWIDSTGVTYILVDEGESPGGPPSTLVEIVDGSARLLREGRYRVD